MRTRTLYTPYVTILGLGLTTLGLAPATLPAFPLPQDRPVKAQVNPRESAITQQQDPKTAAALPPEAEVPENTWVEYPPVLDPALVERGTQSAVEKNFVKVQEILLGYIEEVMVPMKGTDSAREAAFKANNYIMASGAISLIAAPAAGGLIGGGIGAVAAAAAGGIGAPAGGAAGGGIGIGIGAGVGLAHFTAAAIYTSMAVPEINRRYPDSSVVQSRSAGDVAEPVWEDPPQWDDDAVEVGVTEASGIVERTTRRRRGGSRYASKQESTYVHLIDSMFGPEISELANKWDRARYLTRPQRATLRNPHLKKALRPIIKRIAWIKQNHRVSPGARKATPTNPLMKSFFGAVAGRPGALRDLVIDAAGLSNTRVSVSSSRLTWTTPKALRMVGAANSYSTKFTKLYAKVGGRGGMRDPYIKVQITPGPFKIALGETTFVKNELRVSFRIKKGSKLGNASLKYKWNCPEKKLRTCTPRLRKDVVGSLYFKFDKNGIRFTKARLGKCSYNLGLPKLRGPLATLNKTVDAIKKPFERQLNKLLGSHLKWDKCLNPLKTIALKNLKSLLREFAGDFGLCAIDSIQGLQIRNGKVSVKVRGKSLSFKSLSPNPARFKREFRAFVIKKGAARR